MSESPEEVVGNTTVVVFIRVMALLFFKQGDWKMNHLNIERLLDEGKIKEPFSARSLQGSMPEFTREEIGAFLRRNSSDQRRRFIKVLRGWYRCNR